MTTNMFENTGLTGGLYRRRINVDDRDEVESWAAKLQVTPQKLKEVVARVGSWSDDVQFALNETDPSK